MVHKLLVPEADYTLLAGKQKFSCCNVVVVFIIFCLGFTSIGILAYNFLKTAIAEEKLVNNVKVPSWMQWIWNYNVTNSTFIETTVKAIDEYIIVCYFTSQFEEPFTDMLLPKNIDPHLCSHIIIGFASIENCTINFANESLYKQVVELKKIEPKLKVMLSIGGVDNDVGFIKMVLNHTSRKTFIRSVLNVTKIFNFDGIDLDWEFPAWAINPGRQKIHFIQLLYELRKEFNRSGRNLILSTAAAAPGAIIDQSYDVREMAKYIDFINLMSYDYHFYTWYYPVTDLNSPLFPQSLETGYLKLLNVNFSANYWVLKGMPKKKIVVGIPLYGHSYKLYNPLNHKLKAPASGNGDTGFSGFVSYPEICQFLRNGAVKVIVNDSHVPYAYKNSEWISFDDIYSVTYKATWIKSNGFKGAMVFSINMDDWNSTCAPNHRFPLTNAVKETFILK